MANEVLEQMIAMQKENEALKKQIAERDVVDLTKLKGQDLLDNLEAAYATTCSDEGSN